MRTLCLTTPAETIALLWFVSVLLPLPIYQINGHWPVALMFPLNLGVLLTCGVLTLNSLERLRINARQ